MVVVVTDNCRLCRYTECVKVCPVACFHADDEMVYIDGEVCIDCGACVPACPVQAIYAEDDCPPDKVLWIEINRERAAVLPSIIRPEDPLPTAAERRAASGF